MVFDIIGKIDGKQFASVTIENGEFSSMLVNSEVSDLLKRTDNRAFARIMRIFSDLMEAGDKALKPEVNTVKVVPPKLLAVGEAATEPGAYHVVDPLTKMAADADDMLRKILRSRDRDVYLSLLRALGEIKLPDEQSEEPPADEPAASR